MINNHIVKIADVWCVKLLKGNASDATCQQRVFHLLDMGENIIA